MALRAQKVFGTFEKRAPGPLTQLLEEQHTAMEAHTSEELQCKMLYLFNLHMGVRHGLFPKFLNLKLKPSKCGA